MKDSISMLSVIVALGLATAGMQAYARCTSCGSCGAGHSRGNVEKEEVTKCSGAKDCECRKCVMGRKEAEHGYEMIDTEGLKELLESKEEVVLLDARSGKYDDGRRIKGADQLSAGASEKEIRKALPDKDARIVAYCTNLKCPASAMLADKLVEMGYNNVVKYPDGIDGWEKAKGEITKAPEKK